MKLIPGGRWIRHLVWLLIVVASLRAHGQDIQPLLDEAIRIRLTFLAPNSLTLPAPEKDLGPPPPLIQSAGEDFVDAWKKWEFVTAPRPVTPKSAPPLDRKDLINAATDPLLFDDLVRRSLGGGPPPDPAEYDRFIYSTQSFCGNSGNGFMSLYEKSMTLTLLRLGKHSELLQRTARLATPARETLLQAFGIIPEEFQIGAWLHKAINPEDLCKAGGEQTARILMDWVDLRWEVEHERYKKTIATHTHIAYDEPWFPRTELLQLLKPDNGVTDETKARIAKYIGTRGQEMYSLRAWVYRYPKGAEKWLVPLARAGLMDDLNEVRKRSSRILTEAGVTHSEPEMRPSPRFKVQINGMPWPGKFRSKEGYGPGLSVSFTTENGTGKGAGLSSSGSGLYSADPDQFREDGTPRIAHVIIQPSGFDGEPVHPASLWLRAEVPLPIDFAGVNEINIKCADFTISPKFPSRIGTVEEEVYEAEFDTVVNGQPPQGGSRRLLVKGRKALVLSNVSPGEYWLRIFHPGAVLEPAKKVTVSWWRDSTAPVLVTGSNLVVPIEWPEVHAPENLPPQLARSLAWSGPDLRDRLQSVIRLKRKDGSVIEEFGRLPEAARGKFPNSVIYPYLPPGEYEVESPELTIEPAGVHPGCEIRRSAVNIVIREDSPVFVTSEPLKILYTPRN